MKNADSGFSLVELTVVLTVLTAVAGIAISNYRTLARRTHNAAAATDYRNLKLAVLNALADPATPDTFILRKIQGPASLGDPLRGATVSPSVEVSVFHQTRHVSAGAPTTVTTIAVQSLKGDQLFQYDELNGAVVEQVIDLS